MIIYGKKMKMLLCNGLSHTEFRCKCDYKSCRATLVDEQLIKAYRNFRETVNCFLKINSGYRCQRHNLDVKGSAKSRHTAGQAIDISYSTLKDRFTHLEIIAMLKSSGFTFVLWYPDEEFFHCDISQIYNR